MRMNSTWLRRVSMVLAILGIGVAGYLAWSKVNNQSVLCLTGGQCDTVQNHPTSEVLGIPVSVIGLAGYLAILAVFILEERSSSFAGTGPMIVFGLSAVGFLYSLYLTYLELFVINAICSWCVVSAVLMTILLIIGIIRALQAAEA